MAETATRSNIGRIAETHMGLAFSEFLKSSSCPQFTEHAEGGFMLVTGTPHPLGTFSMGPVDVGATAKTLAETGCPCSMLFYGSDSPERESEVVPFGFEAIDSIPAMAVELSNLGESPCPGGYEFHRLGSSDDACQWARVFSEGYGLPFELAELFSPERLQIDDSPGAKIQFFEARQGTAVVAVSSMVFGDGVAGIYCVATLPEHRGKGLGALLTAEPLRLARSQGYEVGVLQASTMGYPIYKKLGFEDVGELRMYLRMPDC